MAPAEALSVDEGGVFWDSFIVVGLDEDPLLLNCVDFLLLIGSRFYSAVVW